VKISTRVLDLVGRIPETKPDDIRLYANARHGIYGRLAALLDRRIKYLAKISFSRIEKGTQEEIT
jgi:hypothetical protein